MIFNNFDNESDFCLDDFIRFSKNMEKYSDALEPIEEFFEALNHFWDDRLQIFEHIKELISEINFSSEAEINSFLENYNTFYNRVGVLLEIDERITDKDIRDRSVHNISKQIIETFSDEELKDLHHSFLASASELIERVEERFTISEKDLKKAVRLLEEGKGGDYMFFNYILIDALIEEIDKQEKNDRKLVSSLLEACIEYAIYLNKIRKSCFEEQNEQYDYYDDEEYRSEDSFKPERNDLCPCGSGKKYKKCCLNKN